MFRVFIFLGLIATGSHAASAYEARHSNLTLDLDPKVESQNLHLTKKKRKRGKSSGGKCTTYCLDEVLPPDHSGA